MTPGAVFRIVLGVFLAGAVWRNADNWTEFGLGMLVAATLIWSGWW